MRPVELECIKAGLDSKLCGNTELLDDLVDTLDSQRVGSLENVGLIEEVSRDEAAVPDLDSCLTAVCVDSFGDLLYLIALLLGVEAEVQISMALRADGSDLNYVQTAAACGARRVICGEVVGNKILVLYHFGIHTGKNHAVLKLKPSELDGRKQCVVTHNNTLHLSKIIVLFSSCRVP